MDPRVKPGGDAEVEQLAQIMLRREYLDPELAHDSETRELGARTVEAGGDFKFNCALVVNDFLVRHGLIVPDHPDYVALLRGLHG